MSWITGLVGYLIIAFIVFVVMTRVTLASSGPDVTEDDKIGSVQIGAFLGILWPLSLVFGVLYGLYNLITYTPSPEKVKQREEAKRRKKMAKKRKPPKASSEPKANFPTYEDYTQEKTYE